MLTLFNTLTQKKEAFIPLKKKRAGLYTCGLTVYNFAHIGNLRTYLFEDILKRALTANGYTVNHVMNITDVGHLASDADEGEDKMELGAKREGKTAAEIAAYYTSVYRQNLAELNILEPSIWAKASDHIAEQIALIQELDKKGFTYVTEDGVYFDTAKFPHYGDLARLDIKGLREGARVKKNKAKKNPTDFALWKFSPKNLKRQMEWPSPWGTGFPGWHIECSAMAMKYLGKTIDIHAGGVDHIPVHHTNEIAQSEAATGKQFVNYWLHGDFLQMYQGKMAKSTGNFITLDTLKEGGYDPLAYRYFCLLAHYRAKLDFTWQGLDAAQSALNRLRDRVRLMPAPKGRCPDFEKQFTAAINNDLNTPQGLAVVWDMLKSTCPEAAKHASLLRFDAILGLGLDKLKNAVEIIPQEITELQKQRDQARIKKDWPESDRLRQKIERAGYMVKDTPSGSVIKRK